MDVYEVLRLAKLGKSDRRIASALGINRKTVGKYRAWAQELGVLDGELPSLAELHQLLEETWPDQVPPQSVSTVAPYREIITRLRDHGVETAAIHQRLIEDHGYRGSYSAVWRFVTALEPRQPEAVVRVDDQTQAQTALGIAGAPQPDDVPMA